MKFTWDEMKRRSDGKKHGLNLANAEQEFSGPTVTEEEPWDYRGERGFNTIGL